MQLSIFSPQRPPKFIKSLQLMLETEGADVIRWSADGKAIEIVDEEILTTIILPKYFKSQKYSSFQRQLNYFGFKTRNAKSQCTFRHMHFTRDNPNDIQLIQRKKRKRPQLDVDVSHTKWSDETSSPTSTEFLLSLLPETFPQLELGVQ